LGRRRVGCEEAPAVARSVLGGGGLEGSTSASVCGMGV